MRGCATSDVRFNGFTVASLASLDFYDDSLVCKLGKKSAFCARPVESKGIVLLVLPTEIKDFDYFKGTSEGKDA